MVSERVASILAGAARFEEYGAIFYGEMARHVGDEGARRLFRHLAGEEEAHMATILRLLSGPMPDVAEDFNAEGAFKSPSELMETTDHIGILEYAIDLEERSIEVYEDGARLAKSAPTKKALLELVEFEKGHRQLLEENLRSLKDEGSWFGYSPQLEG